jgi:calcineurin-like phosphoesterase family protein
MTNWFTSDLHLGHQNIISYCDRPYTRVLDMDEDLVERWNYVVEPRDVVYVVGDFAMGRLDDSLAWTSLLNGTKFLIPGNHDRMFNTAGTKYANSCQRYLDAGFAEIREGIGVYDLPGGVNAIVNHFPRAGADPHDDMQYEDRFAPRPTDTWFTAIPTVSGARRTIWSTSGLTLGVGFLYLGKRSQICFSTPETPTPYPGSPEMAWERTMALICLHDHREIPNPEDPLMWVEWIGLPDDRMSNSLVMLAHRNYPCPECGRHMTPQQPLWRET